MAYPVTEEVIATVSWRGLIAGGLMTLAVAPTARAETGNGSKSAVAAAVLDVDMQRLISCGDLPPDDVFAEIRDLYLVQKPREQCSGQFKHYSESMQAKNSRRSLIQARCRRPDLPGVLAGHSCAIACPCPSGRAARTSSTARRQLRLCVRLYCSMRHPLGKLQVFGVSPQDWDTTFMLLARGAFLVNSSQRSGAAEFVQLQSLAGSDCRLLNPWGDAEAVFYGKGRQAATFLGNLLPVDTAKSETLLLAKKAGRRHSSREPTSTMYREQLHVQAAG